MSRPPEPTDFGPEGPSSAPKVRPWGDLVTELHRPSERAFRHLRKAFDFEKSVVWVLDHDSSCLKAAAVWSEGEVWDGDEALPLSAAPRLRRALESGRRLPFPLGGSLWAPFSLFGAALGFLEARGTPAPVPRVWSALEGTARALAMSVWRTALGVHDRRRDLHLRTLSEVGVLVHRFVKPARLLEDAAGRLVKNLGLDRIKIYLADPRRRVFRGEVAFTLLDGPRPIGRESFDPALWAGDEAPRTRYAAALSAGGETVGWMAADTLLSQREIAMDEVHLLEAVAGQLALAVRNAALYQGVEAKATTDALTGLLLGRVFNERLEAECRRAERSGGSFVVCMLDVDRFKAVNDAHGHPVGDRVLAGVAKKLKAVSRRMDVVARYAGDEFIALLPGASADQGMAFARRLVGGVRRLAVPAPGGAVVRPTISVGAAVYPVHGRRPDDLVRAADEALYRAKDAGRDGAALFSLTGSVALL